MPGREDNTRGVPEEKHRRDHTARLSADSRGVDNTWGDPEEKSGPPPFDDTESGRLVRSGRDQNTSTGSVSTGSQSTFLAREMGGRLTVTAYLTPISQPRLAARPV